MYVNNHQATNLRLKIHKAKEDVSNLFTPP